MEHALPKPFEPSIVPAGESGNARIEKFALTKDDIAIANMRAMFQPGGAGRMLYPGDYTHLMIDGALVMSDTHAEAREHWSPVRYASGHVLLNGLGLGFVLQAMLTKHDVDHITVVEKNEHVLALVAPSFPQHTTFIHADALEWRPDKGERYGFVWHDIWKDICSDNLEDMKLLHRSYGRRCEQQGSWSREYL